MRIGRFLGVLGVASLIAAGPVVVPDAAAASPPAPPFTASVVVVHMNWDYDNVAIAYDVLPAGDAPYHPFDVTGGPSCMVPPVPYYLYDETAVEGSAVQPGPGTGSYPEDPNANYAEWEARGGMPGEYVVVVRWVNYCYRPTDVLPGPSDPPLPQEQAHPQGQPVDVTATVSVYEAGQSSPSSTTVLGGVVIAGAERPANELAVELGQVTLPPTGPATGETTGSTGTGAEPQQPATEPEVAAVTTETAQERSTSAGMADATPGEEKGSEAEISIGLFVLMLVALGLSIVAVLTIVLLWTRSQRLEWAKRQPGREPDLRISEEGRAKHPPTHVATSTRAWPNPEPGEFDSPYPVECKGPVAVIEVRGGWSKVIDGDGWVYWVESDALAPVPQGPNAKGPPTA
jgi:hypothetical protein